MGARDITTLREHIEDMRRRGAILVLIDEKVEISGVERVSSAQLWILENRRESIVSELLEERRRRLREAEKSKTVSDERRLAMVKQLYERGTFKR